MIHSFVLHSDNQLLTDLPFEELRELLKDKDKCIWVDMEQATEEEVAILSDVFNFHPLAIEDCTNVSHYPKIDNFEEYLFMVIHAVNFTSHEEELSTKELNVFLGDNYVVTYHARPIKSVIQTKRKCIENPAGRMGKGADFLAYSIIDAVADNFIPTLNAMDHKIDEVEDEIFVDAPNVLSKIISLRNDILYLRKVIRPQRNMFNQLSKGIFPCIDKENLIYFRDIYDQLFRITEQSEGYRDMIKGILDTHLSLNSNKMNEIMKTLTIVSTIMLPLTLITGVYGMNFSYMPELQSRWGYFSVLGGMFLISLSLITFMKKRKWF